MPNGASPELGLEGPKLFSCQDPRERRMRWCWGAVGVELGVRGPSSVGHHRWGLCRAAATQNSWSKGLLTFQSASTSSARSRSPPNVLPRMIQMGICDSSGLEISNVICKEHRNVMVGMLRVLEILGSCWCPAPALLPSLGLCLAGSGLGAAASPELLGLRGTVLPRIFCGFPSLGAGPGSPGGWGPPRGRRRGSRSVAGGRRSW